MRESAMKLTALIVLAGVTGLALATLQEPRRVDHIPQQAEQNVSGSSVDIIATLTDDWRTSMHEDIQEQLRENLKAHTRIAVQDAPYLDATARAQQLAQASIEPLRHP